MRLRRASEAALRAGTCALLMLATPGCIIGTWPQPEVDEQPIGPGRGNDNNNGNAATAGEQCDGEDDDGDGTVDEGCVCDAGVDLPRDCVGTVQGECAEGVQRCDDARWTECEALVGNGVAAISSTVSVAVAPVEIIADGNETVTLEATVTPPCTGIAPASVRVSIRLSAPEVELTGVARDDGLAGDAVANDGVYSTSLTNLLGPALPPQSLEVEAAALIEREQVIDVATMLLGGAL